MGRAESRVTHPCSLAGAGGFVGPVWRASAPCVPLVGVWRKGIMASFEAPLLLLDAVSFLGCEECVPCTILAGYMCRIRPSVPGI